MTAATLTSTPTASAAGPDPDEAAFLWRVLEQFAFDYCDELFWRVDDGHLSIHVTCSDQFFWGAADCEPITPESLPELIQARRDAEAAAGDAGYDWPLLYCARRRGMRPQGAVYKHLEPALHPLFDACGPERETGYGNPVAR